MFNYVRCCAPVAAILTSTMLFSTPASAAWPVFLHRLVGQRDASSAEHVGDRYRRCVVGGRQLDVRQRSIANRPSTASPCMWLGAATNTSPGLLASPYPTEIPWDPEEGTNHGQDTQ